MGTFQLKQTHRILELTLDRVCSIIKVILYVIFGRFFGYLDTRNFDPYEGFRQAYSRPGPFTDIPSICNQRSLANSTTSANFRPFFVHGMSYQGPLITDGRNSCKWTGHTVGLSKSFIRVKISGQNF